MAGLIGSIHSLGSTDPIKEKVAEDQLNKKDAISLSSQQEPMEKCQVAQCVNDYQD